MSLDIIREMWEYATYNKPFLLLILVLFFIVSLLIEIFNQMKISSALFLSFIPYIFIVGYGMTITKDVMNNGKRLPKISIKDAIILGIKSTVVSIVYIFVQELLFTAISSLFHFPMVDFEKMVFDFFETVHLLYSHDPVHTAIFIAVGFLVLYVTMFFMEIALAKLADTGSVWDAFNLSNIKKTIDVIGWGVYAKHYTVIILTLAFFSLLLDVDLPIFVLDCIFKIFLGLLLFITQYWGIGAIYGIFKRNQANNLNN